MRKILRILKKPRVLLAILFGTLVLSCAFSISVTLGLFTDTFSIDESEESFVDCVGGKLRCYPLDTDGGKDVGVIWDKDATGDTGTYTIPMKVRKDNTKYPEGDPKAGQYVNEYTVKAVLKSGFRYTNFSKIYFEKDNNGNGTVEEIQEEAFYSCQSLTYFEFPQKCVRGIGSSAFMDCRSLQKVDMVKTNAYIDSLQDSDANYIKNNHFDIGDHAFSSCVSLKGFAFPASLRTIGESAFHKCAKMYVISLPDQDVDRKIVIERYAFADCSNLSYFHMTTNVSRIDEYAFVRGNAKLKIYYSGDGADSVPAAGDPMYSYYYVGGSSSSGRTMFNRIYIDTDTNSEVEILFNKEPIRTDEDHPGFYYMVEKDIIYYQGSSNSSVKEPLYTPGANERYVTITSFMTPEENTDDYTDVTEGKKHYGKVIIPSEIAGLKVRKIQSEAFSNLDGEITAPIISLTFQDPLIQICDNAFTGCENIREINFKGIKDGDDQYIIDPCTTLKEIGHEAFSKDGRGNSTFTGVIDIPNSVRFIGNSAFHGFKNATGLRLYDPNDSNVRNPCLEFIGNKSFKNVGNTATAKKGTIDLLLPKSLNNSKATSFKPKSLESNTEPAVGSEAFAGCHLLKTVKMQSQKDNNPKVSFGTLCFSSCEYLLHFKASRAMTRLGRGVFEKCAQLKEVFLSNYKEEKDNDKIAWGTVQGSSLFDNNDDSKAIEFRDVVIYVDAENAPDKAKQVKNHTWNSDLRTYNNEYATGTNVPYLHYDNGAGNFRADNVIGRPQMPTYYQVNFHNECDDYVQNTDGVKYFNISTGAITHTSPTTSAEYSNSVAFIKAGNQYTITRCYASGNDSIDMSTWNTTIQTALSSSIDIETIGDSAFATLRYANASAKIILPNTVKTICSRAFYTDPKVYTTGDTTSTSGSIDNTTKKLAVVTYKSNSSEVNPESQTNYCALPTSLTKIDRFAFYNNIFATVTLPNTLSFLGNSAFITCMAGSSIITKIGIDSGTSSYYTYLPGGKGMYDTSSKTLLYYVNGTSTLDLSTTTLEAIGARTFASSTYSEIKLPGSIETIYGGAFNNSKSLTKVTFGTNSSLTYLGALPRDKGYFFAAWNDSYNRKNKDWKPNTFYVEGDPVDDNFDVADYGNKNVPSTTINTNDYYKDVFTNPYSNLIPYYYEWYSNYGSFANCTSLEELDFTKLTSLAKIGYGAFEYCSNLEKMTSGSTYSYYKWKSGVTEANVASSLASMTSLGSVTKGVLDLSGLTSLRTIGRDAFRNCDKVKFVHLPLLQDQNIGDNSVSDKSKQAYFWLGMDYDEPASWYQHAKNAGSSKKSVFDGTAAARTGGAVLVGESAIYACPNKDANKGSHYYNTTESHKEEKRKIGTNPDKYDIFDYWDGVDYNVERYGADSLPSSTSYYYIRPDHYSDDIYEKDNVKFWTTIGNPANHNYILFDSWQNARSYFQCGYALKADGAVVASDANKPSNVHVNLAEGQKFTVTYNGNALELVNQTGVTYFIAPTTGEFIVNVTTVSSKDKFSIEASE